MLILTIYNIMASEQTRNILRSDLFLGPLITDFQIKKEKKLSATLLIILKLHEFDFDNNDRCTHNIINNNVH